MSLSKALELSREEATQSGDFTATRFDHVMDGVKRYGINWVRKHGFTPFAIYRIALAIVLIVLLMRGSI